MNVGLKRGEVRLVPYDSEWPRIFDLEKRLLVDVLGDVLIDIQHVGSTSVVGLCAKPIIDIAAAVSDLSAVSTWVPKLEAIGYTYFGDREGRGDLFLAKGPEELRTVYVHLVDHGGTRMEDYLRFRDRLVRDPLARAAYASLKQSLASAHPGDRKAYTDAKAEFISEVLKTA